MGPWNYRPRHAFRGLAFAARECHHRQARRLPPVAARTHWAAFKTEQGLAEKLGIGATFPSLTLNLVDGGTLEVPGGLDAKYRVILFYRGHW